VRVGGRAAARLVALVKVVVVPAAALLAVDLRVHGHTARSSSPASSSACHHPSKRIRATWHTGACEVR
jgi:hypothetical protein